MKTSVTSLF